MIPPTTVRIERLGADGDGIATTGAGRVYVERALPGDLVRIEATVPVAGGRRATAATVVEAVPRAPDRCPHAARCGGCRLQHAPDALYVAFKRQRVVDELVRHGFDPEVVRAPAVSPPRSRRRARLGFARVGRRVVLGFRERHGERLVDVLDCAVLRPELVALLDPLRALLASVAGHRGEVLLTLTTNGVDALIRARPEPGPAELERIAGFARLHRLCRVGWDNGSGPVPIATLEPATVRLGGLLVELPQGAFLQATAEGEAAIVEAVLAALPVAGPCADLYAGCGTLALALLQRSPVRAFEIDAASLEAALRASAGRLVVERRDLDRDPLTPSELDRFVAVTLDPPYRGAQAQVGALASSTVARVAYVSCNPRSFARDAATLRDGGYTLEEVLPIDQFTWSSEVELVATLRRRA